MLVEGNGPVGRACLNACRVWQHSWEALTNWGHEGETGIMNDINIKGPYLAHPIVYCITEVLSSGAIPGFYQILMCNGIFIKTDNLQIL